VEPDLPAGTVLDPDVDQDVAAGADAEVDTGAEPEQSRPAVTKRPSHSALREQLEQRLTVPAVATIAEPTAIDDPDPVERLATPRNVVTELRAVAAELSAAVVPESLRMPVTLIPVEPSAAAPEIEPLPAPSPPRVLASAVSTLLGGLSNPLGAGNSPLAPAASPALWAALAAARREIGLVEPTQILSAAAKVQQTVAPLAVASVADQPIGLAPGIVVSPELLEHVTRTAPAGLLDQFTNAALGVMRQISDVIGVNIAFEISRVMSSGSPPWFTTLGLSVTQDTYGPDDEQQVWVIAPKNPSGEYVVALHGGGFQIRPNVLQWLDYASMARETGATVIVPMYPLAHEGGDAATVVPPVADYITELTNEYGADNVSIYGDSAGALIGMLAAQEILRRCNEQGAGRESCLADDMPTQMVLISPALGGHTMFTDPNVELVDDPVFSAAIINDPDSVDWQGDLSIDDPLWNPMYGPTEGLPTTVIYVGTRDIATPGTLLFAERLLDEDTDGDPNLRIVMGMGHIHDWALGGPASNTEASKWRGAIYRELGLTDQQEL